MDKKFYSTGRVAGKVFAALFLFCILFGWTSTLAQKAPVLYQKIQLSKKEYAFDDLTHVIQRQTGLTFSYNAATISSSRKYHIRYRRIRLITLFKIIKEQSGVGYKLVAHNIIYTPPAQKTPQLYLKKHHKAVSKKHRQTEKAIVKAAPKKQTKKTSNLATVMGKDSVKPEIVYVIGDSLTAASYYYGGGAGEAYGGSAPILLVMRYPSAAWHDPYASLNPPDGKNGLLWEPPRKGPDLAPFFKRNLLVSAGFTANEIHYFNPTLKFGLRFVYAQISYDIGKFSQMRYGLGVALPLKNNWTIGADFNIGKGFSNLYTFPKNDTFMPQPDTLNPNPTPIITTEQIPVLVKSKLTDITLSVAKTFNSNITVSAGFTLNYLTTHYFSKGEPVDLPTFGLPATMSLDDFPTLKPPYILTESYNNGTATGLKTWMGFRIGIFYRINFRTD